MKVIDLHCDTLYELNKQPVYSLKDAPLQVNLNKLKAGNYLLQNFAIFTDLKKDDGIHHVYDLLDIFHKEVSLYQNEILQVKSYQDIVEGMQTHKLMGMLTLEEGDIIDHDLSVLDTLYDLGIRMITLTWNYPNALAYPNVDFVNQNKGLTELGKAYVKKCNELGIIVDVSHASDQTFYDVLSVSSKPVVASHSNSRTICHHSRNLTDEMILQLSEHRGIMGINYYRYFVSEDHQSSIQNLICQLDYIKALAGIDVLALGSDFDGIDEEVELKDASYLPELEKALYNDHWTKEEIEKLFYKNVLRVYKEVL